MPDVQNIAVDLTASYVARKTFDYADDLKLHCGQVFQMRPAPNNEKLIRLGYVERFPGRDKPFTCRVCGRAFATLNTLNAHGRIWHPEVEDTSKPADVRELERMERIDRDESRADPIRWDRTAASIDPVAARHDAAETKSNRKYL
jgi:hypothetical protein